MLGVLDFYPRANARTSKKSDDQWSGAEGDEARRKGVENREQFAVYTALKDEMRATGLVGVRLTNKELAKRSNLTEPQMNAALTRLLENGLFRRVRDIFGVPALVPSLYL